MDSDSVRRKLLCLQVEVYVGPDLITEVTVLGAVLFHNDPSVLLHEGGLDDLSAFRTDRLRLFRKTSLCRVFY